MKKLLVLGAGTAGTMVVNKLRPELDLADWQITIVDENETHYYQPGFLFIPFGTYTRKDVVRRKRDFMPPGVDLVVGEIDLVEPEENRVKLADGTVLEYDQLVIAMVTRLVDQKGVDIALGLAPYLEHLGARLVILGSGQANLVDAVRATVDAHPHRVAAITDRYDEPLAHRIFAGADLFVMPSRFEPCGLAQMQAMAYGSIPVATAVGGLVDTITDADTDPDAGTGFLSQTIDLAGLVDATHRAVRAHLVDKRRRAIQKRGMATDWSWAGPAVAHIERYEAISGQSKR